MLPILSGQDCIRLMQLLGYKITRQKGSHVRLICVGRSPLTVPLHATLDRGTLRSIIRAAGLTVSEFSRLDNGQ